MVELDQEPQKGLPTHVAGTPEGRFTKKQSDNAAAHANEDRAARDSEGDIVTVTARVAHKGWHHLGLVLLVLLGGALGAVVKWELFDADEIDHGKLVAAVEREKSSGARREKAESMLRQHEPKHDAEEEATILAMREEVRQASREEAEAIAARKAIEHPLGRWQSALGGAVAAGIGIFVLAAALAGGFGVSFDTAPSPSSITRAFFVAVLIGMSGITYLRLVREQFERSVQQERATQQQAETTASNANALSETVHFAQNASGERKEDARGKVREEVGKTGDAAVELTQRVRETSASSPESAKAGEQAVVKAVEKLSAAAMVTPVAAIKEVEKIAQAAQAASLSAVEQKARDVLAAIQSKPEYVRALVEQLPRVPESERERAIAALGQLGQPAVTPMLSVAAGLSTGSESAAAGSVIVRSAIAAALVRMKEPVVFSEESARAVLAMLSAPELPVQARRDSAEFLMNLSDGPTIRAVYAAMKPTLENPSQAADDSNAKRVFNTALILGTWARNLVPTIKAPGPDGRPDPEKPMSRLALEESKALHDKLKNKKGWAVTLHTLEDLIEKAEAAAKVPSPH